MVLFFEQELLSLHILDVLELRQSKLDMYNSGRNFSALSFRYHSSATLWVGSEVLHLGDRDVAFFPARLDYRKVTDYDEMIVIHFDTTNYQSRQIEFFSPKDPEILAGLFREIYACWSKKEVGYRYRATALLYEILAECYRQNYRVAANSSKIRPSVDFMLQSFRRPDLRMEEIARQSFMSEVYFRKLFKKEFGVSPQKYLIRLRIQNAVGLISTGYYSLKEIAYLSGYQDYKYFSVEFKKAVGVSPSEYLYNYREDPTDNRADPRLL